MKLKRKFNVDVKFTLTGTDQHFVVTVPNVEAFIGFEAEKKAKKIVIVNLSITTSSHRKKFFNK